MRDIYFLFSGILNKFLQLDLVSNGLLLFIVVVVAALSSTHFFGVTISQRRLLLATARNGLLGFMLGISTIVMLDFNIHLTEQWM